MYQSEYLPTSWTSHPTPIHKSGDRSYIQNYRPIIKINIFANMLGKIILANIFATIKTIIIESQHGFFHRRSLEINLLI